MTSRMAMDNIKTNRTINDSRIRGSIYEKKINFCSVFSCIAPTDLDLLQLTMNRMQRAESDVRYLNSELKDKVRKISRIYCGQSSRF